ncbi:S41 family peptidase [Microbulbifer yueqingensis]|uniref:Peptidase family S41 n=1 Tax=Microbulbifer yueqingensis TaxID=658219 RepID=A0A1G8XMM8_9GAMM|nr:S41 family peptidase [Microbulbifer yueqingensis]SDJ91424.1 Peptidase family S41 [Microbulbifer yueqingensis]
MNSLDPAGQLSRMRPFLLSLVMGLAACGGGGGGDNSPSPDPSPVSGSGDDTGWVEGNFLPSDTFVNRCAAPRSGATYPDVQGSALDEKNWLRSWSHELYLWYDEIEDLDPADYAVQDYFDLLVTNELTDSGARKDNFHFSMPTAEWVAQSESGVFLGYGLQWALLATRPPRHVVIAYTEQPGQPAGAERGARVLEVDGVDLVYADDEASINILNDGLFPETAGEEHEFKLEYVDGSVQTVTFTSGAYASDPVQFEKVVDGAMGRKVGYLLFNDHIAVAEKQLVDAVNKFNAAGIDELVLDLRYNGGGLLAMASQLAYMIAGEVRTEGRTFEQMVFNDKYPAINPVTGQPLTPMPFIDITGSGGELPQGQPLPSLAPELNRVFVLTGGATCSASEAIINGLRGVDVEVIQVGGKTCGKPYGFYPTDNCGTTYFSIQFKGVNDKGFGEYSDGFVPGGSGSAGVTGCQVEDDFDHQLGDPVEGQLATALEYIETGSCPSPEAAAYFGTNESGTRLQGSGQSVFKSMWRENRIIGGM